jgi:hypothetical protein
LQWSEMLRSAVSSGRTAFTSESVCVEGVDEREACGEWGVRRVKTARCVVRKRLIM